jgi:hypothetical protein
MSTGDNKYKMDSRCPRQLEKMPDTWCPLGVQRLKAIRNAGHELSEEEEAALPGCPWAVDHQLANYCFFKYIAEFSSDKPLSDMEIASLNNVSIDTVKKTEKIALNKVRENQVFKIIKEEHKGEAIVADSSVGDDYKIFR